MPLNAVAEAGYLAQKYDPVTDSVLLVRFAEEDYNAASFLDDRILAHGMSGFWSPIDGTMGPQGAAAKPIHFIFHTGHVGSTLLSRLLAPGPSVLPVREPLALRTLADMHDALGTPHALVNADTFARRLGALLNLWSRGFARTEMVIIKATSTAGRIAPALLDARPDAKAVYLNVSAESYIATLLAGSNAMVDLRGHAVERNRRLERAFGEAPLVLHRASGGELAAMAWLAETLAQRDAATHAGPRVLPIDFETMLADIEGTLTKAAAHFGIAPPNRTTISREMSRYSKGPEHPYSPQLRAQLLNQARSQHAAEIRKGLGWLQGMAARFPQIAASLHLTKGG